MNGACASGFCADGVCCDQACGGGGPGDCQACSKAAGSTTDGTCEVLSAGALCRPSSGACDVAESCPGANPSCPSDVFAQNGSPCAGGACVGGACVPSPADGGCVSALQLSHDAVLSAAVGAPYRYSSTGQVNVTGAVGAVKYSACAPLVFGFQVDPATGLVYWVPSSAGRVSLCVQADDGCKTDSYFFDIDVTTPGANPPVAVARASPSAPNTGQTVTFDGTLSTGRFRVRLAGVAANGCIGTDTAVVVVDEPPYSPPVCVATSAPSAGVAPLSVSYAAKYVDPNPGGLITSAKWSFDDGTKSSQPSLSRVYAAPG